MKAPHWLNTEFTQTLQRLQELVRTPSFSKEEEAAANLYEQWMQEDGVPYTRVKNNLWSKHPQHNNGKPVLLLNSHLDTVKPNAGYTRNPFDATITNGKLYGLGSNDAGAALLCLYAVFKQLRQQAEWPYQLVFAATAEEEISGTGGIEEALKHIGPVDLAIVGEPTGMQLAVAEKGLLVLDAEAQGVSGHAAHQQGVNAIYEALNDINWFRTYQFPKVSPTLGPVHMSVTMIQAGTQHNVIPASCTYTVDIRNTDVYTHEALLDIIRQHVKSRIAPRSLRLQPSGLPTGHPLYAVAAQLGIPTYGSPTCSDQALIPCPSVKIGPGQSTRSHQADEYIETEAITQGLLIYHHLLNTLLHT